MQGSPTTLRLIGGVGGSIFSITGDDNGSRLEKIVVWVGPSQIKGVQAWLSDGRFKKSGTTEGQYHEYVFQAGECFSSLSLWQAGTQISAIMFKTNTGGQFAAKMTSQRPRQTEYHIDVGSGYCLGIIGRSGADIDNIGFLFLNQVESAVLMDVEYPDINNLIPRVVVESIEPSTMYKNHSSVTQKGTIQISKEVSKTSTWSVSASFTALFTTSVKAGIPAVFEAAAGFTFRVGVTGTYSQSHTDKKTETVTTFLDVPPKKKTEVLVTIGRAAFDLPYTGTMVITCINGSVLQYKVKGKYKGVTYTDVKVETRESDLP